MNQQLEKHHLANTKKVIIHEHSGPIYIHTTLNYIDSGFNELQTHKNIKNVNIIEKMNFRGTNFLQGGHQKIKVLRSQQSSSNTMTAEVFASFFDTVRQMTDSFRLHKIRISEGLHRVYFVYIQRFFTLHRSSIIQLNILTTPKLRVNIFVYVIYLQVPICIGRYARWYNVLCGR